MAGNVIPAAVPGPNDPPENNPTTSAAPGMLASMLAPVAPARTTAFNLDPQAAGGATAGAADAPVTGASSASYHGDNEAAQKSDTAAKSGQQKGIWRAWLLAGAARWGKGGGVQNKRLDLAKAKAQAQQVKEARRVSINRTEGPAGKGPAASGSGGKSLNSKAAGSNGAKGPAKGQQNSSGGGKAGPAGGKTPAGRSGGGAGSGAGAGGSGSRGPQGGSSTSGKGSGVSPKPSKADGGGRAPKPSKVDGSKGGASGGASGGGSGTGSPTDRKSGSGKGADPKDATNSKAGKQPDGQSSKGTGPKDGTGTAGSAGKNGTPGPKGGPGSALLTKDSKPAPIKDGKPDLAKGAKPDQAKGQPQAKADQPSGKPFSTREARETGYRDGTRAAKAAAHVKAYGDGVKDGWSDTKEAADREKARLDKAHEERKQMRDKEQPVNAGSSADYHQPEPVKPIEVRGVTGSHVLLGDGAGKDSMSRGEVRSLKSFERRLAAKSTTMQKVAEDTKGLKAHAEEQANKATRLLEAAKAVKGGEKLAASLAKLQEAAQVQSGKAEEIHQRAVRAADACRTVLANVETRYGGMYKAVVDSPETSPAETLFYLGDHHG